MTDKAIHKIEVKEARKVRKFAIPISINIIMLALGICLLIWADKVTTMTSIVIGVTFLVYAAYNLIAYFRVENRTVSDQAKLITGIALAIAGVFLITQSGFLKELISVFIGVFILVESILRLQDVLATKNVNPNYKNSLGLAVIGVACGALCILGKIVIPDLILQVLGILLIIFALTDTAGGIMVNQSMKTVKAKVIDEKK